MAHRVTCQGSDKINACITFSVREALPGSLTQICSKSTMPWVPCFMQKQCCMSSSREIKKYRKQGIGLPDARNAEHSLTHSMTYWTSRGCFQLKCHHSFENKKQNTFLGGSDYADSKKLTTMRATAPGLSSLIAWALSPKLKNSFPYKQSPRTDLFFCSINNSPQSTVAEHLVCFNMQVNQVQPVMQLPSSLGRRWWNCA